jgi:prepilin peptidase CpaA
MSPRDTVAIGVALLACLFDLRSRRIPNALTFGAAFAALAFAAAHGLSTFESSILGCLLGLALWMPVYALGGMGAGDVKLLAAIGAWLGPLGAIHVALYGAIAGGAMALVVALAHGYFRQAWSNVNLLVTHWYVAGFSPQDQLTLDNSTAPKLAYAMPTLVGTAIAVWFR